MSESKIYIVEGKRTAFGKFGGSLIKKSPVDLATYASQAVLESVSVSADKIDQVIFANVVPASTDTMYAGRHIALRLGCPEKTPGYCVNRLCGSGIQVITDAVRLIKLGEASAVMTCGAESMSMIPHLVYGSRFGTKYGALKTVDMLLDALTDKHCNTPMGITAENLAEKYNITREDCDKYSLRSHQKAASAYKAGHIQGEIVPIDLIKNTLEKDEHLRMDASIEQMNKLPATFKKDGVVSAGSASGIVDGGAAILVASEKFVQKNNLTPLAEIKSSAVIGVDPSLMGIGPVPVIKEVLEKTNLTQDDIDLFEVNEAFSAQVLSVLKELDLSEDKVNVWGGAVALGHPLGATGLKITLTLARALKKLGKKRGISSACIGGGQGIALMIESI